MWDVYTEGGINAAMPMASLHAMHEIHVLLVDHEPDSLIHTAKQLELCHYRGTITFSSFFLIFLKWECKIKNE